MYLGIFRGGLWHCAPGVGIEHRGGGIGTSGLGIGVPEFCIATSLPLTTRRLINPWSLVCIQPDPPSIQRLSRRRAVFYLAESATAGDAIDRLACSPFIHQTRGIELYCSIKSILIDYVVASVQPVRLALQICIGDAIGKSLKFLFLVACLARFSGVMARISSRETSFRQPKRATDKSCGVALGIC